jgi:hypothetical protein
MDALKDIPTIEKPLQTLKGDAFLQKTDIFKRVMWFGYRGEESNWIPVTVDRVQEILAMNVKGERPQAIDKAEAAKIELDLEKGSGPLNADLAQMDRKYGGNIKKKFDKPKGDRPDFKTERKEFVRPERKDFKKDNRPERKDFKADVKPQNPIENPVNQGNNPNQKGNNPNQRPPQGQKPPQNQGQRPPQGNQKPQQPRPQGNGNVEGQTPQQARPQGNQKPPQARPQGNVEGQNQQPRPQGNGNVEGQTPQQQRPQGQGNGNNNRNKNRNRPPKPNNQNPPKAE